MNDEAFNLRSDDVTREKLVQDIKTLIHDAEELIKTTADGMGETAKQARDQLTNAVDATKQSLESFEERATEGAKAADRMIRDHPYESIGIAFGIGLLFGALVNRR